VAPSRRLSTETLERKELETMKRYVCTVAAGLVLALAGSGTAAAEGGLPLPGQTQSGAQSTTFGDQTVGKQSNDADVTQEQGNGNVNISPAISIGGDASTTNAQGNGNSADATVTQGNTATQSQSSDQSQSLEQSGSGGNCCAGSSQTGEQYVDGGEQTVEKQTNDADVTQYQGNGNVNVSPAISIGGDASTRNAQGNGNNASADVDQSNEANQSQDASQRQRLKQDGGCCGGQSQTGTQQVDGGDQTVEKQRNDTDVTQKQGNKNVNVSPALAFGGKHEEPEPCRSKCYGGKGGAGREGGDASTWNAQGNGNDASANVGQSNSATQSQSAEQDQRLSQSGGGCKGSYGCKPKHAYGKKGDDGKKGDYGRKVDRSEKGCCGGGQSQTGTQHADGGDQAVEKQRNDADVTQKQGNKNVNYSPARAFGGKHEQPCRSNCYGDKGGRESGNASTKNAQGNGNHASASVGQSNAVEQSQSAGQAQELVQACKEVVRR
jgi:hypothetical protein